MPGSTGQGLCVVCISRLKEGVISIVTLYHVYPIRIKEIFCYD